MPVPYVGQIWGNYQLKRFIAKGGFGWVFEAEHKWLKSPVAIKILDTNPYRLQKDIELFLAEAQKLQALKHPHIAEVKDFGIAYDMPYLVMPLYKASLSSMRGRILPLPTIVAYVKHIAAALNYVHQHHIVHRDIKPENLLLGNDGEVILSDFGIAILTHSVKADQEYAGTAPYMPPEQWKAQAVRASDQYALAIVVYQWLCGELPFRGTALEVMGQHMYVQPLSLRRKNPAIEEDVEDVVMKALAKDPAHRFQTILEFAEALEKAAKQFHLELLLVHPVPEGETIMDVEWVWGNHYSFVHSRGKVQIIDVLNGETVFSSTYNDYYVGVFWVRKNCTESFPKGILSLTENGPYDLTDTRTGKRIGWIAGDDVTINTVEEKYEGFEAVSQSPKGRRVTALANSLIQFDPGRQNLDVFRQMARKHFGFLLNTISEDGERISFCLPQWQFVAVARVDEQGRIHQIEVYRVVSR